MAIALLVALPLVSAASVPEGLTVRDVVARMIAGEPIPEEILDRTEAAGFANLDQTIAAVKGCEAKLDPFDGGSVVEWQCKGLKAKDQPSVMLLFVKHKAVVKISTARKRWL